MSSGGGNVVPAVSAPSKRGRWGHRQQAAWLPLDIIIAEIAARSDPATLVHCAATCREARRCIVEDPGLGGRLRLRDTQRFVLPLLHGHLTGITGYTDYDYKEKITVYMVDTTGAADATRLVECKFTKPDQTLRKVSMDSRGGLVLVCATTTANDDTYTYQEQKLVCNMATHRFLTLPPEPAFPDGDEAGVQYVLLVGGSDGKGAVGRRFQVLKAKLMLSEEYRSDRRLLVHTFSSEHGAWSPLIDIPTPDLLGSSYTWKSALHRMPLVVGDVVHWLCLTDVGSYMLTLHVGAARVHVTSLPARFPGRDDRTHTFYDRYQYLLVTATAGGNPMVLVADNDKVSAWVQSMHTKMWKPRPYVVIENKTVLEFKDDGLAELVKTANIKQVPELLWFGERSGVVLLRIHGIFLLWLNLHSQKIVRCFSSSSDRRLHGAQVYCPYEIDLSSWVPTFSSAVTL